MRLEHVALNVSDPVAAAQWYAEHLGMQVVRSSAEPPHMHFLADSSGQSLIELYHNPAAPVPDYPAMPPINLHLAFLVEDMEAARDLLVAAGATAVGEPSATPAGDRLLFLRDPWGVPLQLVQRAQSLV